MEINLGNYNSTIIKPQLIYVSAMLALLMPVELQQLAR